MLNKRLLISTLSGLYLGLGALNPAHADARDEVLALYTQGCQAVALPEPHGERLAADFREDLVRHPDFRDHVDTVAVEFASAFHQDLLDRWVVEGEDLPLDQVRPIWQDTTQMFIWDAPVYERFFRTVRETNLTLPREDRVRILALAPAVNWQAANDHSDVRPLMERGRLMPQRAFDGAIAHGESVLIIVGSAHYIRRTYRGGQGNGSAFLDHHMDGRLCVLGQVDPQNGRAERFAEQNAINPAEARLIFPLSELALEDNDAQSVLGLVASGSLEEAVDGVLFLGTDPATSRPPASVFTDAYVEEWRRRVPLLWPQIDPSIVDRTVQSVIEG